VTIEGMQSRIGKLGSGPLYGCLLSLFAGIGVLLAGMAFTASSDFSSRNNSRNRYPHRPSALLGKVF